MDKKLPESGALTATDRTKQRDEADARTEILKAVAVLRDRT
jgi:hypothetical protein